ncbi:MAG TPA: type II toxin-antitoxin system PemK/MazF family toxin [Verrucomicrobiae bacterium]|nr:type II toxin-antitoxin system PemK/MazF family toxin [Verrucomicrobiae bacterium]
MPIFCRDEKIRVSENDGMFKPGEIVHAAFPFTDLTTSKRRPCLVLACCDSPDDFILAFISSSAASNALPHSIAVDPRHAEWSKTGLKRPSLVRADKLTTLHLSVLSGAIGALPDDLMRSVREKIRQLLCVAEGTRTN